MIRHALRDAQLQIIPHPDLDKLVHIPENVARAFPGHAPAIRRGEEGARPVRMREEGVAVALDDGEVLVWRHGTMCRLQVPVVGHAKRRENPATKFGLNDSSIIGASSIVDVSPDGSYCWLLWNYYPERRLLETPLDEPNWREIWTERITEESQRSRLDEIRGFACLDANHMVVAFGGPDRKSARVELLRRDDGEWKHVHQVKSPGRIRMRALPKHDGVVLTTGKSVMLYGREGDRLVKLAIAPLPYFRGESWPRCPFTTAGGEIWIYWILPEAGYPHPPPHCWHQVVISTPEAPAS